MDHGSQRTRQRLADLVRSAKEQMAEQVRLDSLFGYRLAAHTANVKQPKRSKQAHPWRLVDPKALGEFPPLEGLDLPE